MLIVTVEVYDGDLVTIASVEIVNDQTGNARVASYRVTLKAADRKARSARVENFHRERGAGDLVGEAFRALKWPEVTP